MARSEAGTIAWIVHARGEADEDDAQLRDLVHDLEQAQQPRQAQQPQDAQNAQLAEVATSATQQLAIAAITPIATEQR